MTTIRVDQWTAFERALQRLYVLSDPIDFPVRLLEAIRDLIGSEINCYTEIIPAQQHVRNVSSIQHAELDALLPVLAEFQLQHPRIVDYLEHGQQRALATSDYFSRKEWHACDLQRHFYGAMGLEDQLVIMMPAAGGAHLGLVFNRTRRSFTKADRALLDLLRPHLALAYANAQRYGALSSADQTLSAPAHGVVRLRADGTVLLATRIAAEALDGVRPPDRAGRWALPPEVRAWVRQETARAADGGVHAPRRAMRLLGHGRSVALTLLEETDAEGWVLAVEDRTPGTGRASIPADLPPRLRRLLERMLLGRSEKALARELELSAHTVHEYVKQLYRRLGVGSRAELMARFMVGPPARP